MIKYYTPVDATNRLLTEVGADNDGLAGEGLGGADRVLSKHSEHVLCVFHQSSQSVTGCNGVHIGSLHPQVYIIILCMILTKSIYKLILSLS